MSRDHAQPADDELRRLVARADPLPRSSAPVDDARLLRLTENAMTHELLSTPSTPPARRRRFLVVGIAAAAVAAASVAIVLPLAGAGSARVTELALPNTGGPMDMCAPVSADTVGQAQLAFRGTVTSIDGGVVTLQVADRFAGDVGDTVEVPQSPESVVDGAPITFEADTTYLIAATDGVILTCGRSATDSPELAAIYDEAFPG